MLLTVRELIKYRNVNIVKRQRHNTHNEEDKLLLTLKAISSIANFSSVVKDSSLQLFPIFYNDTFSFCTFLINFT